MRLPKRWGRWLVFLIAALVGLHLPLAVSPSVAQGQHLRLGDMRVDWFCLQRGYGAWIINNGIDWACTSSSGTVTLVLTQTDFSAICQRYYGNPAAYAVRTPVGTLGIRGTR